MRYLIIPVALLLFSSTSFAIMPPSVYHQAALNAQHHVQIKVLGVKTPRATPGSCRVSGKLVRIFRSRKTKLKRGQKVSFTVSCKMAKDRVKPGPVYYQDVDRLKKAKFLEVCLNSKQKLLEVALFNAAIIRAPTNKPTFLFEYIQSCTGAGAKAKCP